MCNWRPQGASCIPQPNAAVSYNSSLAGTRGIANESLAAWDANREMREGSRRQLEKCQADDVWAVVPHPLAELSYAHGEVRASRSKGNGVVGAELHVRQRRVEVLNLICVCGSELLTQS